MAVFDYLRRQLPGIMEDKNYDSFLRFREAGGKREERRMDLVHFEDEEGLIIVQSVDPKKPVRYVHVSRLYEAQIVSRRKGLKKVGPQQIS